MTKEEFEIEHELLKTFLLDEQTRHDKEEDPYLRGLLLVRISMYEKSILQLQQEYGGE